MSRKSATTVTAAPRAAKAVAPLDTYSLEQSIAAVAALATLSQPEARNRMADADKKVRTEARSAYVSAHAGAEVAVRNIRDLVKGNRPTALLAIAHDIMAGRGSGTDAYPSGLKRDAQPVPIKRASDTYSRSLAGATGASARTVGRYVYAARRFAAAVGAHEGGKFVLPDLSADMSADMIKVAQEVWQEAVRSERKAKPAPVVTPEGPGNGDGETNGPAAPEAQTTEGILRDATRALRAVSALSADMLTVPAGDGDGVSDAAILALLDAIADADAHVSAVRDPR